MFCNFFRIWYNTWYNQLWRQHEKDSFDSRNISRVFTGCLPVHAEILVHRELDGGRALYLLLAWLAGPGTAEWGCRWVGISTALAAASGTAWLVWRTGGSFWLLPAVMGLLLAGVGWRNDR